LLPGLDAIGGRRNTEMFGQPRDRQNDGDGIISGRQTADEATIYLDLVKWKSCADSSAMNSRSQSRPSRS
jgi:hypothetical protein